MTALFHLTLYIIALATMTLTTVSASAATNVAKPKPMTAQVMAWNSVGERCDKHCIAEAGRPNHASVVLIRQGDLVCGSAVVD